MFHSPNQKKTVFYKRKKKEKEKKGPVLVTLLYFLNFEQDISTYFFNYITVMCPDIWLFSNYLLMFLITVIQLIIILMHYQIKLNKLHFNWRKKTQFKKTSRKKVYPEIASKFHNLYKENNLN